jgi:hypothetical protein
MYHLRNQRYFYETWRWIKTAVVWDVTQCGLEERTASIFKVQDGGGTSKSPPNLGNDLPAASIFNIEVGDSIFLRNVDKDVSDYTTPHHRRH